MSHTSPVNINAHSANNAVDNSGFEEVAHINRSRASTISIALPSSILANAQSPELRMYLAGQVARAAAIYRVDEIVIFSERLDPAPNPRRPRSYPTQSQPHPQSSETVKDITHFFATVLDYLDTPQYLRKHLFPMSADLRLVGLLNPLALPSHVSRNDTPRFREGVVLSSRHQSQQHQHQQTPQNLSPLPSRYVDVGLDRLVEADRSLPCGSRVTVDMSLSGPRYERAPGKYLFGRIVSRDVPCRENGVYWGYRVRTASALSGIFSGSVVAPHGYDLTIGTSERGTHISTSGRPSQAFALPDFSHLLIVFGGVHGLECSVIGDEKLTELGIIIQPESQNNGTANGNSAQQQQSNVGDLFDFYLNTCPQQGSRTIRTEEAVLMSLAALQPFLNTTDLN